ncbi:MAG: putative N-acetylmuramoyl-L-alanine amidase [Methanolobus sp. T82-4]|nr:MAG: putative N-acetylmuramoyl-L-alanine amidase [Methanolobus sp. T82-4]
MKVQFPDTLYSNTFIALNITLQNSGLSIWNANEDNPIHLSYHWIQNNQTVIFDGERTPLPENVKPRKIIDTQVIVKTPEKEGNYTLILDVLKEGNFWFEQEGVKTYEKNIQIV